MRGKFNLFITQRKQKMDIAFFQDLITNNFPIFAFVALAAVSVLSLHVILQLIDKGNNKNE